MEKVKFKTRLARIGNSYYFRIPKAYIKNGMIPEDKRVLDIEVMINNEKKQKRIENPENIELLKKLVENPELLEVLKLIIRNNNNNTYQEKVSPPTGI